MTRTQTRAAFTTGIIAILGGALLLQSQYLLWGEWSYDQGYYLLVARLIDYGYQPYTEIFMSEPPLMAWSISLPLSFFGSVEGMQLIMIGYGLLGVAALISIGVSLDGKLTGLLAGALLAFNFEFFFSARKVMPEVPSMSLALISLALALRYHTSGRQGWVVGSGLAMGGSLLIKYFMPWLIPLIVLLVTIPSQTVLSPKLGSLLWADRRRVIRNWVLWGGSLFSTMVLMSGLAFDLLILLDQTILFHLFKSAGTERNLMDNADKIWATFSGHVILSITMLLGLGVALARFKRVGWVAITWLALALIFLFIFSPLRNKHLILLMPIMALLAASALTFLLTQWRNCSNKTGILRWSGTVAGIIIFILLTVELTAPYKALAKPKDEMVDGKMEPLLTVLDKFTSPVDCLITDNPYLAFVTDRLPPPWFSALSYARFASGTLDKQSMVDITNAYECQIMAPTLDRIKNANRPYYDWAKENYLRVWVVDGKEVMLGKPLQEASPDIPLQANFAEQVELIGADWLPSKDSGYLSLYWRTLQPFSQNYKIFVQLRDNTEQTIASADHEAYDGLIPTQSWPVNAILKDTNRLDLPTDLQQGSYSLYIGIYDPNTLERLPIINDISGENAAILSEIVIQ